MISEAEYYREIARVRDRIKLLSADFKSELPYYEEIRKTIAEYYALCQKGQMMEYFTPGRISNYLLYKYIITAIPRRPIL